MKSRFEKARKWLLFWTLFIGIGAVGGSACIVPAPPPRQKSANCMSKKLPTTPRHKYIASTVPNCYNQTIINV